MRGNIEIIALLMPLIMTLTRGHTSRSVIHREDPCISLCEKTPATFANNMYVKSCCQRGCRFFNLVDLRYGLEPNSLNGTRNACEASCTEAYIELQDRYACGTGCDFMAKQRVSDLLALFSIAICMEDGIDSNVLLMSPDVPENDILTDPGLRKELLPRWWDSNGFKLPQTYVKTVPMDAGTVDYALSSDYSGETEQAAPMPPSNWFHCASKHIRYWHLAPTIVGLVIIMLFMFWAVMLLRSMLCQKSTLANQSTPSTVTLYIPLYRESMYKEPPPKYVPLSSDDE
ncbi:uncharacterized protein LOC116844907 [Odontomachus brunneus]|uniref:uncharacterized protein LOC116844907 n=1 Tax=Odontomachus brunneus TaxID=486640 RepID=UPI0013F1C907|nr:uncharacterized protein LOC116844907 [Odontomachus brunneus]